MPDNSASRKFRSLAALSLVALLAGGATLAEAQQQQVQARVISTSPVTLPNGSFAYNVTYEYAGRQYNTRTNTPPGASIMVNASDYGSVATTSPVAPQPQLAAAPVGYQPGNGAQGGQGGPQDFPNVVPEQGVVVSGDGGGAPPPMYAAPAPVYVQPAPVYYAPAYYPGYAVAPYAYPPIGISLGFGYSRGWGGGGYYGGRWR